MSLGFITDQFGIEKANEITKIMEYRWDRNKEENIFDE
jgi:hypothetical protein